MPEIKFGSSEEKAESVAKELRRIKAQFSKIPEKKKRLALGLMERAAFMRVALAELEADINENGFYEMFSQGDQKPYQRKRPSVEVYGQTDKNYQTIMKQLIDLLPKDAPIAAADDGFESFVAGRDDG